MSVRLTSTLDVETVLREVLDAALEVNRTSLGLLSLCDAAGGGLALQVQSGFDPDIVRQMSQVPPWGGESGTCYLERRRVVVEDVEADPIFAPYREVARAAGSRACHSTPLTSRGGDIIGVLSVHFPLPYRPSERETRLMDLYARIAADAIENARLHQRVQQELEERKQSLVREHVARAEAESANRMKDEFLATVSHELRTPLNAIVGWAHILQRPAVDPSTLARGVEVIGRNAHAQARLIEDILDVSRVVTGSLRLNIGLVDPAAVIAAAIEAVRLAADAKGIRLEVVLDPFARRVAGDPGRLQQVVWNLLSNAIKFTPSGGRVHVRLSRVDTAAEIVVNDTGEGIAAEFLPFIFDRFRQADSTITRRHGGLGLGLAIVRHLVELHGGEVRAESAGADAGATFTIRLPLADPGERAGRPASAAGTARWPGEAAGVLPVAAVLDGVEVLVVDDDRGSLDMLVVVLTGAGAAVRTAASAAEARELLRRRMPDVVVSDLAMPGEDGHSLIESLRRLEAGRGKWTPAVALTAYVRAEDRARALAAGFNTFVQKPVDPGELLSVIATLARSAARTAYFRQPS
jgi:signal transduction histidine kinase/CheY-like chemotaxis protein